MITATMHDNTDRVSIPAEREYFALKIFGCKIIEWSRDTPRSSDDEKLFSPNDLRRLCQLILHGDSEHRDWLTVRFERFIKENAK